MVKSYRVGDGGGPWDYTVSSLGQVIVISRPRSLTILFSGPPRVITENLGAPELVKRGPF